MEIRFSRISARPRKSGETGFAEKSLRVRKSEKADYQNNPWRRSRQFPIEAPLTIPYAGFPKPRTTTERKPMSKITIIAALLIAAMQGAAANAASFLFIRHAESTANAGTATTVEEMLDPPLTALGQQQALDLADVLAGYNITTIYTSAYQRTQQTIAPTAAHFGLTPTADARTNEWYVGDVELGGPAVDYLSIIGRWAMGDTAAKADLPNAESLDDMVARVLPAWQEMIAAHKDEDGVVAIVGHGAEIGFVMSYFAQNVSSGFAFSHGLDNTGIVELEIVNDKPYVTSWQGIALPVPASVPEPATWLMLLVGFGAIGAAIRSGQAQRLRARIA
ncbi:histidine phosphatase family protein [Edaphosphingomonas haloaromaticamans]|nr:histidine phosphatase family protein [Sphingomonas haloaromaticamans]